MLLARKDGHCPAFLIKEGTRSQPLRCLLFKELDQAGKNVCLVAKGAKSRSQEVLSQSHGVCLSQRSWDQALE
jgi:hypothetical protein